MGSGNFLIGNSLSLEGFRQYVQPILEKREYSVQDILPIQYGNHKETILASVVGEGDLEKGISEVLAESEQVIHKAEAEKRQQHGNIQEPIAYSHQVSSSSHLALFSHPERKNGKGEVYVDLGQYKTLGTYQADDTASNFFQLIAQKYLLAEIELKADKVVQQFKNLLEKKLSDL